MRSILSWGICAIIVCVCVALALLVGQLDIGTAPNLALAIKAGVVLLLGIFAVISVRDAFGEPPKEMPKKDKSKAEGPVQEKDPGNQSQREPHQHNP